MRLVDIEEIIKDDAFRPEIEDDFEPDPVSGETLPGIPSDIKQFYRETLEDETLGVAETIKVALAKKINGRYEIVRILE